MRKVAICCSFFEEHRFSFQNAMLEHRSNETYTIFSLRSCMFELLKKIPELKTNFNVERFYNVVVVALIGGILLIASLALTRPISPSQYQYLRQLTQQYTYPETQQYAQHLTASENINLRTYFKLLHVYQAEAKAKSHLPAQNVEMK